MITVPISYFDPTNGQATTLKERIDELFKTDNRVKVTELNKEYGIAQITELMADVTSFLSKNRMQGNLKLSRNNYANNTEFIKAIKDEFNLLAMR